MKKITLKSVEKVLNDEELKNILGGSSFCSGTIACSGDCKNSDEHCMHANGRCGCYKSNLT
ncbi:TIGR04149 family rSAM-modified RiPP [Parabacteroides sp. OttesenSCG-928-G21]|nr:TIGR04149 family rSAM-modified RiPP [Parabacteroides sp. OttesenSCG-928-G21]